jgi:hypothetical protein
MVASPLPPPSKPGAGFSAQVRKELVNAEKIAKGFLDARQYDAEAVETVLSSIKIWPTQARPNVTATGKPVSGMCLGLVNVLGGVGMQVSAISKFCPQMTILVARYARSSIKNGPDDSAFPFSSVQVNHNYAAKRHVDGNNIGPSYICSVGEHAGGKLWVADTYVESASEEEGSKAVILRGGGGEGLVDCHRNWQLFNGNAEHETRPFHATATGACLRISMVAFTHSSYCKLTPNVAEELRVLGFTAGSSDGVELPFFQSFRLDKTELSGDALAQYELLCAKRRASAPPPSAQGSVAVECNGYTAGRGAGWISFATGSSQASLKKRKINSFFTSTAKPKKADSKTEEESPKEEPIAFDLPAKKNGRVEASATIDHAGVVRIDLPRNRTGLWVAELDVKASSKISLLAIQRFDVYKETKKETKALVDYVGKLPTGRVLVLSITDTAIAKTRPLAPEFYACLREIGAPTQTEPIGYRQPFALIGVKGMRETAVCALDKTKVILRLEATLERQGDIVQLSNPKIERTDITEHIIAGTGGGGKEVSQ